MLLVALLATEALVLSLYFDPSLLLERNPDRSGWLLGHSPVLLRIGVAFSGALLIVLWSRPHVSRTEPASRDHSGWWGWLLAHLTALAVFAFISARILEPNPGAYQPTATWLMAWIVSGIAALLLWMLAFMPRGVWTGLIRRERVALGIAVLAAVAAWAGGLVAQRLWRPLAETTFLLTAQLLGLIQPGIVSDANEGVLGNQVFQVEIAPACSGYEGMALVTVFIAIYLWLFRGQLHFPQALLLFPLGITAIYLANVVRLAALVLVGTYLSPQMAVSGFHSQAGWITFTLIAVGIIAAAQRFSWFAEVGTRSEGGGASDPASALLVPFFLLMATSMLGAAFSTGFDMAYPLPITIAGCALFYYRRAYRSLRWQWSGEAVIAGTVVAAIWILLEPESAWRGAVVLEAGLASLPGWLAVLWLAFRFFGSALVVPVVEELAFRGYLIRKLVDRDFEKVPAGRFTWFSFLLSSLLFGLLHERWLVGFVAGMVFALALYRRGRLGDAVVAHVTANALIGVYVLSYGQWSLWA